MSDKPRVTIEPAPKWIRGMHRGSVVVDSRNARLVWEVPYYPAWYFPIEDVHGELVANGETFRSTSRGEGTRYDLVVDGETVAGAAYRHVDSPVEELRDLVRLEWDAMDTWFEEDVEVHVHPRSPHARVDVLASSRHVRVLIDGEVIADSVHPTILFETNLPPRYYLPQTDVDMTKLTPTDTSTGCPHKGFARYWTVTTATDAHEDLAWGYLSPLPESLGIGGLVCFYNEKVDLEIDGVVIDRPRTHFS